jgi:threonine dehydrogenase-like Zn-dependent dehydrogenase
MSAAAEPAMLALLKEGGSLRLTRVPAPSPTAPDDVLLRVVYAGVCRTDLLVADGRIPSRDPLVLGHELSGIVEAVGSGAADLAKGDRVTVAPLLACRRCARCERGLSCGAPEMLGVARHGAFAERLVVPRAAVHRVPDSLPLRAAAYVEPVAAALAVLRAGLSPDERGLVYGKGRVARLVHEVLAARGFTRVEIAAPGAPLSADEFDFAIETCASTAALRALAAAVRPGGRIVLKSRLPDPVAIDLLQLVPREITLTAVHYGSFAEAIELLASGRIGTDALFGAARPLADFASVLAEARAGEEHKLFFSITPDPG